MAKLTQSNKAMSVQHNTCVRLILLKTFWACRLSYFTLSAQTQAVSPIAGPASTRIW